MNRSEILYVIRALAGLLAGGLIGYGFGTIQNLALRRHQRLQQTGSLSHGWSIMPGSMRRVAGLLVALVLIQVLCPLLFVDGMQWWVSGGLIAAYGWMLFRRLHRY